MLKSIAVDFEQPRALWQKVFDNTQKEHFVGNVASHLGNVKSPVVKARQRKSSNACYSRQCCLCCTL